MSILKLLAMYLPQYHEIKENNEWWGKGYTEWTAVKRAKPLYKGHSQPRIPLNNNYYDLSDETGNVWNWQAQLAKKYGIYGFCIYHYWFETGSQLLEKPMEILLKHKEIDINYCICWANETWARNWYGLNNVILKEQKYGDEEEWKNHFNYLLDFFKDKRYIKIDNRPVVNIYHTYEIERMKEMRILWEKLARENGFNGIYLISGNTLSKIDERVNLFDAYYNFEPGFTLMHYMDLKYKGMYFLRKKAIQLLNKFSKNKKLEGLVKSKWIYKRNLEISEYKGKKCFLGTYPNWDNTPRRSYKGRVYKTKIDDFYINLLNIKQKLRSLNRMDDFVYINAWNEWGEGAYLEPDTLNKYAYLEKIKSVIDNIE